MATHLLQLVRLRCHGTDDTDVGIDEAYIKADDSLVWGPQRIRAGQEASLEGVAPLWFDPWMAIDLYDDEPQLLGGPQSLGRVWADDSMAELGDIDMNVDNPDRGKASYTLTFRVTTYRGTDESPTMPDK
jgi:hypothetical protein